MGFTHKQPFVDDDCYQSAYTHLRQLDYGGHLASLAEFPSLRDNSSTSPIKDEGRDVSSSQSQRKVFLGGDVGKIVTVLPSGVESRAGSISNCCAASALNIIPSVPFITGSTSGAMSDHPKRPFRDSGPSQVEFKRVRQVDQDSQINSLKGISSFNHIVEGRSPSVAFVEDTEKRIFCSVSENPGTVMSSSISNLTWLGSTIEEDTRSETPSRLSSFPGYFEDGHRPHWFNQFEELSSPVFDSPRKLVPIGPNNQADLPLLIQGSRKSWEESSGSDKWLGTCILPMPDAESLVLETRVGKGKMDCYCRDDGTIRFVRQHVREARERLRKILGEDNFKELGFCDMGEDTANKWTEEEEELFDEVVISNPLGSGNNFWNALPWAFPSRSTKELVSYYFNVFMLRKRAEQNRSDPLNVDSDNDEWQGSGDADFVSTEEDEDSVVESPVNPGDVTCKNDENGIHEKSKDGEECDDYGVTVEGDEELYGAPERCFDDKSEFAPVHPTENNPRDCDRDQDVRDDSCTSYGVQHNKVDPCVSHTDFVGIHDSLVGNMQYQNDGYSGVSGHEYIVDYFNPKTWGISYVPRTEKDVEFLPTCNVIEEVFGKVAWEDNAKDSHDYI